MKCTLRAIRINKGVTQEEASKEMGIKLDTLANYEKGNTYPSIPNLEKILKYYNVKYDEINFLQ